jgi:hypothetical protein
VLKRLKHDKPISIVECYEVSIYYLFSVLELKSV